MDLNERIAARRKQLEDQQAELDRQLAEQDRIEQEQRATAAAQEVSAADVTPWTTDTSDGVRPVSSQLLLPDSVRQMLSRPSTKQWYAAALIAFTGVCNSITESGKEAFWWAVLLLWMVYILGESSPAKDGETKKPKIYWVLVYNRITSMQWLVLFGSFAAGIVGLVGGISLGPIALGFAWIYAFYLIHSHEKAIRKEMVEGSA